MVHLRPRIAHDFDIFGEEIVSVLEIALDKVNSHRQGLLTSPKRAGNYGGVSDNSPEWLVCDALTVFFLAKSPDAPSTTMMVLSLSSMLLQMAVSSGAVPKSGCRHQCHRSRVRRREEGSKRSDAPLQKRWQQHPESAEVRELSSHGIGRTERVAALIGPRSTAP